MNIIGKSTVIIFVVLFHLFIALGKVLLIPSFGILFTVGLIFFKPNEVYDFFRPFIEGKLFNYLGEDVMAACIGYLSFAAIWIILIPIMVT